MGYPLHRADKKLVGEGKDVVKLAPGSYESKLIRVKPAKGWVPGTAYELIFKIKVEEEKFLEKPTVFQNSTDNKRTREFIEYLEDNGVVIKDFEELLGLCEILDFAYEDVNGKKFLNVYHRNFVGFEEAE